MKDPFLYRADDSLGGQPGRADGVRRVEGANSLANARLEGKGATLITGHWMNAFSHVGEDWAGEDFERRMRKNVREVMASNRSQDGPGSYRISQHFPSRWRMDVHWKNKFESRCKADWECVEFEVGTAAQLTVFPFDPRVKLRKPRHCSHFRLFFAISAFCDFDYSAKKKCYEPARPDLLGLQGIASSDFFPVHQPIVEDLIFGVGGSDGIAFCERSQLVIAVGIEFWYFGKTAPEGRLVNRAMVFG